MSKQLSFACDRCKTSKRKVGHCPQRSYIANTDKCDSAKPVCSLCQRQRRECVYTESRPRKRKYWDEDYVRALEAQVQSLLSILEQKGENLANPLPSVEIQSNTGTLHNDDAHVGKDASDTLVLDTVAESRNQVPWHEAIDKRSNQAMEELCVMLWRTNVGDGVTIINDTTTGSRYSLETSLKPAPALVTLPEHILSYCQDTSLMEEFALLFLNNINKEHQFTTYTTTDFLIGLPYQSMEEVFLHCTIIATGSTFSDRPDASKIGDAFAEFAESLVFSCCRQKPSIKVIQGLSMSSWRSLALGRDHFGWIFISMAAGMCVHLRLHVLALDECDSRRLEASEQEIRTFWMFYIIDRTAISILGRNCALPWRRVNVPSFDSTFTSTTADLAQISFAAQCQLWYLHDQHMDQVFSSSFDALPITQQVRLLVSSQEALSAFFHSRDRLQLSGDTTPKPVLLFHLAYQMTILITMPPFLRIFASFSADSELLSHGSNSKYILLVLRSLTAAATATVRLVRTYKKSLGFDIPPNPVIIHHLLSAAIVHLMNATSNTKSLRNQSTYWVRQCLELLRGLGVPWPNRAERSIKVIRVLAQRWGVTASLPLDFSYRVEPNSRTDGQADFQPIEMDSVGSSDVDSLDWSAFADFGTLPIPELTDPQQANMDTLTAFGALSNCDDFSWLS
ncbi:zn 2cys6 transcription factor [Ilyonectria robusta]